MTAAIAAKKVATILRCVERARAERDAAAADFKRDYTRQDAALLNIIRACEAAVDLANMLIRERRLGVPSDMKDSFRALEQAALIPASLAARLRKMIGFRNIAVHQYQALDIDIVDSVIRTSLADLITFAEAVGPHFADRG